MNIERMLKFNNNRTYCLDCLAISTIGNQTVQHAAIQLELASATNHANNPKSPSPGDVPTVQSFGVLTAEIESAVLCQSCGQGT
jgi:hypothetical protein